MRSNRPWGRSSGPALMPAGWESATLRVLPGADASDSADMDPDPEPKLEPEAPRAA